MLKPITICLGLSVLAAPGVARADLLLGLDAGTPLATATTALSGKHLQIWSASAPQALRLGLVDSDLLEAVNRARAGRLDGDGALDARAFDSFLALHEGGVDYVIAFDEDRRLSYLLAKLPTPIGDPDPFAKARLRPLVRVVSSLRRLGLREKVKDRYGNPQTWRGATRRGGLWARYVPEAEAVWLLLHAQARSPR